MLRLVKKKNDQKQGQLDVFKNIYWKYDKKK